MTEALSVLDEMKRQKGCKPDLHNYSILIDGLSKMGEVSKAVGLILDMEKNGIMPGMVTYSSLLHGLCKTGEVKAALKLFRDLDLRGF
ncbi:pentatricopeptide repeat-containing protein [Carex littledalei]|uniref:Pentatricopeptide repeat-containing protein n=1 Tax=Carex littledalei TaxID=544730 RepID=A0A833QV82_9POAL|nr:pentatricopeptide repeat-containing protein [Carex littledalei]